MGPSERRLMETVSYLAEASFVVFCLLFPLYLAQTFIWDWQSIWKD